MANPTRTAPLHWTVVVPIIAVAALAVTWGRTLPIAAVVVVALLLAGAVLAAVHHAEVVAHRVGEPFGSLVLAVAVTVIEVALIVTLMADGKPGSETLARDTVFAAVMITTNGIMGISLLVGALRHRVATFNPEGTGGMFATVTTITTLSLVLPTFTTTKPGRYCEISGRLGKSGEGLGEPKATGINPPPLICPRNSGMLPNIMSQLPEIMSWMAGAPPR